MKKKESLEFYDVFICGGGIAGLLTAYGLAEGGKKILITEQSHKIGLNGADVLKPSGIKVLEELDLIEEVMEKEARKRTEVDFFHDGEFLSRMDYSENNDLPYFFLVPYGVIATILKERLNRLANVEIRYNTSVESVDVINEKVVSNLSDGTKIQAELVVGSDGGNSIYRRKFLPETPIFRYEQKMFFGCFDMVDSVEETNRLYTDGKFGLAYFYPINSSQFRAAIGFREKLDIALFEQKDLEALKVRLRQFVSNSNDALEAINSIDSFVTFPLCKMTVESMCFFNSVLVGNSAHQINPITGQGMNLAIEDAGELIRQIQLYYKGKQTLSESLSHYNENRLEVGKKVVEYGHNLSMNYQTKEDFAAALNLKIQTSGRKIEDLQFM